MLFHFPSFLHLCHFALCLQVGLIILEKINKTPLDPATLPFSFFFQGQTSLKSGRTLLPALSYHLLASPQHFTEMAFLDITTDLAIINSSIIL